MTTRAPRSSPRPVASHRRHVARPARGLRVRGLQVPGLRVRGLQVRGLRVRGIRVRGLRVRTKLAAVLTIPLLGFLAVTGVQVGTSVATASQLDDFSRQVALGREVTELVHEVQRERDRTAGVLAGLSLAGPSAGAAGVRNVADLAPDRTAVDRAAAALATAATPLRGDPTLARAYQAVESGLAELPRIRDGAQAGWLREQGVFDAYTSIITDLHALMFVPAAVGGDVAVGQAVRAFVNVSRAKELTAQIRGQLYVVCTAARFGMGEFELVTDVRAQRQAAVARFRSDANGAQITAYDEAVSGQAVRTTNRLEQTVVDNARAPALGVDAQQWWQASTTELELMRGVESHLLDAAVAAAEARSASQWRATVFGSVGSVLLLVVALLTSFVIGRTMISSLRSLRAQAHDVALRRLPRVIEQLRAAPKGAPAPRVDPITVRSGDEVGEVADAFTAVLRSAVRLATEQASMRHNVDAIFVNLARRSQTLVERQLQLLDELESGEEDPEQLANLFRLDHLATRMRRNDNNLLVLAGGEPSRRWTEPVPMAAVILAAAAEIEQYTRVHHDITDNVHLVGHAVADIVHLVAELLENATIFSPPDTAVTVLGWATDAGGAALVIQDEGIGLTGEGLALAEDQVAVPMSIDVAAAERMGLVVVGHLAHRQGIRVQMRSTGRGLAVFVEIPADLVVDAPAEPLAWSGGPGRWIRTEQGAIVGATSPADPAAAEPAPARRGAPTRAEDVLGAGRGERSNVWWSRLPAQLATAAPAPAISAVAPAISAAAPAPAPVAPVTAASATVPSPAANELPLAAQSEVDGLAGTVVPDGVDEATDAAGLPVRVPMANLPRQRSVSTATDDRPPADPDPEAVGSVLSSFYGGVHLAALEDDDLESAVNGPGSP